EDMMIDTSKFEDGLTAEARRELIMRVGFLWNCIFKRELLEKNDMTFRENCIYEDIDFLEILYFKAESIGFVRKSLYLHRDNERSSSRKRCDTDKFFNMIDEMIGNCLEKIKESKYADELRSTLEFQLLSISADIILLYAENKCMTFNRVEKLNDMIKKHFGDYTQNEYFRNKAFDELGELHRQILERYSPDTKKFYNNVKHIKYTNK
ncbi:MAG: hypothetical protein IJ583_17580, partial [Firmicutes bacterium]|nr:hypothetical protein [Bacillota bacterium]